MWNESYPIVLIRVQGWKQKCHSLVAKSSHHTKGIPDCCRLGGISEGHLVQHPGSSRLTRSNGLGIPPRIETPQLLWASVSVLGHPHSLSGGQPQHAPRPGVTPPCTSFAEMPQDSVRPYLQLLEMCLDGSTTLWCVSHPTRSVPSAKLLRVYFAPSSRSWTRMFNTLLFNIVNILTQPSPLGYTTSDWPTITLLATRHHPLDTSVQPLFNPACCSSSSYFMFTMSILEESVPKSFLKCG